MLYPRLKALYMTLLCCVTPLGSRASTFFYPAKITSSDHINDAISEYGIFYIDAKIDTTYLKDYFLKRYSLHNVTFDTAWGKKKMVWFQSS